MSRKKVIAEFPDVPELEALLREPSQQRVMRGKERVLLIDTARDGSKVMIVDPAYLQRRFDPGKKAGHVSLLRLRVGSDGLIGISLADWRSPQWNSRAGFIAHVSKLYGFSPSWWKERKLEPIPAAAGGRAHHYVSQLDDLTCKGFRVSSDCIGPPGPPGMCTLNLSLRGDAK